MTTDYCLAAFWGAFVFAILVLINLWIGKTIHYLRERKRAKREELILEISERQSSYLHSLLTEYQRKPEYDVLAKKLRK